LSTVCHQCWDIVNSDGNHYWYTRDLPNGGIEFDFTDRLVSLTHSALKSDGLSADPLIQ
jgi:hypothetical protein